MYFLCVYVNNVLKDDDIVLTISYYKVDINDKKCFRILIFTANEHFEKIERAVRAKRYRLGLHRAY